MLFRSPNVNMLFPSHDKEQSRKRVDELRRELDKINRISDRKKHVYIGLGSGMYGTLELLFEERR